MRPFRISKQARILCGGVLLVIGYSPVLVGFLGRDNGASFVICETNGQAKSVELKDGSIVEDFSYQLLCKNSFEENGLLNNVLQNKLLGSLFHTGMYSQMENVTQDAKNIKLAKQVEFSPVKIISCGEFAGSKLVKSEIHSNFYADARKLGIPAKVVDRVINKLSSKIDFRRSLKRGDQFEIVYDQKKEMLYARIITKYKNVAVYKFTSGSASAYYFENGAKIALQKNNAFGQPLSGKLRVTSGFGYRKHPITYKYGNHTGIDLYANYGTPVYAIFEGIVTRASRHYGYGNCIDIKHKNGYTSRYAHLSKYSVRCGSSVKRGQEIGLSGNSGSSTGPHLHLELAKNNRILNPFSVKMMPEENTLVSNMKKFNDLKKYVQRATASSR